MEKIDLSKLEGKIVTTLKNIFDPEIPVNIYDLGLIYEIDINKENVVNVKMTLTAPNCPMADDMLAEVHQKIKSLQGVADVNINLVFDPPWSRDMMSEEALLELGLL